MKQNISKSISKWFTLIEMLMVVVIIGIIMSIIFLIYKNMYWAISDSQQIKNISQELLYTNTYIQNIADKSDIKLNYDKNGSDSIVLTDKDTFSYTISKKCDMPDRCYIYTIDKDWESKLTNPDITYISSLRFISLPFENLVKPVTSDKIKNIYNHGFWMMAEISSKKWAKSIYTQTFFDIKQ